MILLVCGWGQWVGPVGGAKWEARFQSSPFSLKMDSLQMKEEEETEEAEETPMDCNSETDSTTGNKTENEANDQKNRSRFLEFQSCFPPPPFPLIHSCFSFINESLTASLLSLGGGWGWGGLREGGVACCGISVDSLALPPRPLPLSISFSRKKKTKKKQNSIFL